MIRSRVKVTGLRNVEKALGKLEKTATRKTVARNALKNGGVVIADAAKNFAPEDDGDLRRSITVSTKLTRRQKRSHRKIDPVEVFAGPAASSNAVQQEIGNVHHAAQPYMRPAYDGYKNRALAEVIVHLKSSTDKAIERQSKRLKRR